MLFLLGLVFGLLLLVAGLGYALLASLNRANQVRWGGFDAQGSSRARLPARRQSEDTCCHDVACSARCAQRTQALMIAGAVDVARSGAPFQELVTLAERIGLQDMPGAAAPRDGTGSSAA